MLQLKRYGNLYPQIISFSNLLLAARKAFKGKKTKPAVAKFYFHLEPELLILQKELLNHSYRPLPLRMFTIREPKVRQIGASDIRDRVVHHAICHVAGPFIEKSFIYHSYACRERKGTHRAIKQAQVFSRKKGYFLKCDIRKYFDSIDHNILKKLLSSTFKDKELLWLLGVLIDSPGLSRGIPIGNLTSQYFANLYLSELDHYVKQTLRVRYYLRYMDDFLLFADDKAQLHLLHSRIMSYLEKELRLTLKHKVTCIAPVSEGVPFLGCSIFPGLIRIKRENKARSLKKLKLRQKQFCSGLITESQYSHSLMSITEHLKVGNTYELRKDIFSRMFL